MPVSLLLSSWKPHCPKGLVPKVIAKVGFVLKVSAMSESLEFGGNPVMLLLLKKAAASVCTAKSKLSSRAVALVFSSK